MKRICLWIDTTWIKKKEKKKNDMQIPLWPGDDENKRRILNMQCN